MSSDLQPSSPTVPTNVDSLKVFLAVQPPGLLETLRSGAVWQRVEDLAARRSLARKAAEKGA